MLWEAVGLTLDERGRRLSAAVEARTAGWGALAAVARIMGLALSTMGRCLHDRNRRRATGRRNVATPVFGGMILASFTGIFAIPPLYVFFQSLRERLRPASRPQQRPGPALEWLPAGLPGKAAE